MVEERLVGKATVFNRFCVLYEEQNNRRCEISMGGMYQRYRHHVNGSMMFNRNRYIFYRRP